MGRVRRPVGSTALAATSVNEDATTVRTVRSYGRLYGAISPIKPAIFLEFPYSKEFIKFKAKYSYLLIPYSNFFFEKNYKLNNKHNIVADKAKTDNNKRKQGVVRWDAHSAPLTNLALLCLVIIASIKTSRSNFFNRIFKLIDR